MKFIIPLSATWYLGYTSNKGSWIFGIRDLHPNALESIELGRRVARELEKGNA